MKAFTFRVAAENQDDVYRDILIAENSTFEDFHFAILKAFKIKPGEMASFYTADEKWNRGDQEITLLDMGEEERSEESVLMSDLTIGESVSEGNDFFVYVYDFLFCKNFELELIDTEDVKALNEPKVVETVGVYQEDLSGYADLLLDEYDDDGMPSGGKKKKDVMDDFDDFDNFQEDDELNDFNEFDDDNDYKGGGGSRYDDDY